MERAEVALVSEGGQSARLVIARLPSAAEGPELRADEQMVLLREARVYRYQFQLEEPLVCVEPAELFNPDDLTHRTGRLLPGEAVGLVSVEATTASGVLLRGRFDVGSAKFSDEAAFGQMLADLATLSVESLHQGFAPSAGQFAVVSGEAPTLLYQQFAVLNALLAGTDLSWAITQVFNNSHRAWDTLLEPRQPGRPLRGSSRLSSQMGRPGARVLTPGGVLPSLPAVVLVQRTETTLDTPANRFVRFVLERWRALASAVVGHVASLPGAAKRRGLGQAQRVLSQLDEALGDPLFREVGRLVAFPGDNPVLRRREGYRQISSAAALVEGSLGLELDLEDPFLVSRRNIATLYEYWTFVRLAGAVANACGAPGSLGQLFRPSKHGMSLVLRAGALTRLAFEANVGSEQVLVDLFFNNEFRRDSWTRPMRPDASLLVRRPGHREVWLHFDAKYRVDWLKPFETGEPSDEEDAERSGTSKRTDLLKMHAYRDAIRNSAGSYVLFPGTEIATFSVNDVEFLPGLGAFPFRPDHADDDAAKLETFVSDVLRHVAGAGTRHGRATYWAARAYAGAGTEASCALPPAGDLPPADTPVLLGYVRSDEQWAWIRRAKLYNVRSGQRAGSVGAGDVLLDAPLVLLYGREGGERRVELYRRAGPWRGMTADTLQRLGYTNPRGGAYLVASLEPIDKLPWIEVVEPDRLKPSGGLRGEPFSTSWLDLVLSAQDNED